MYVQQQQAISEERQRRRQTNFAYSLYRNKFSLLKLKKYSTVIILLVIISIATLVNVIDTKVSNKNENLSEQNEIGSETVSHHDDDQSNQFGKKRMSRSLSGMGSSNGRGYINVYIRQSCRNDRRYPFKKMRFPYIQNDRRRFRFSSSWVMFSPIMPMYANRFTRQTIIYSPTGVYIFPPLVNFYGKLFSVAELIAYGYATLLADGALMPPFFNIAPFLYPGSYFGMPRYNPRTGTFMEGIRSKYQSYFKPNCRSAYKEKPADEYPLKYVENLYEYRKPRNPYYYKKHHPRPYHKKPTTPQPTPSPTGSPGTAAPAPYWIGYAK